MGKKYILTEGYAHFLGRQLQLATNQILKLSKLSGKDERKMLQFARLRVGNVAESASKKLSQTAII